MTVQVDKINKICIFAWSLKGDLFIRVPIMEAVAKRFPDAEITAVVDPNNVDVFENHPDIANLFPFNRKKKPLLKYIYGSLTNILTLRKEKFDLSIDLYNGGLSPDISRLVNARIRLGFDHTPALRRASNLLATHPRIYKHWTREISEILRPLGIDPDTVRKGTSYYCSEKSRAFAKSFLADYMGKRLVAINLGAGAPNKCWPVESFVETAVRLSDKYGFIPVVFTNPGMEYLTDRFVELYSPQGKMLHLPRMPFDREAAIIERCEAIITGDTSLMHLASGVKCPILALFLETAPEAVEPEDCLFVACCKGGKSAASELSIDYVIDKFEELERKIQDRKI